MFFLNETHYFDYFYEKINDCRIRGELKIATELQDVCDELKLKIEHITKENFFEELSAILGLDARLQIILELISFSSYEICLSEEEIIKISRSDYRFFLKDLIGVSKDKSVPHSLLFSVC